LIQCSHFANTSAAAVINEKLMGFISGYLIPQRPDTLFIWQVAVGEQARGRGLATKMLLHILERNNVNYLETTITKSNRASWALFEGMAKKLNADIQTSVMFDQELHFANQHDTEMLVKLGPFKLTSS
ncbi:MAG: diaminobutyrate acetyltransferase, partial [Gammaproteobacteria bacterium]|nr:diaminobutyrate acetyltransferase [Gammaproteobacteria bacterium]